MDKPKIYEIKLTRGQPLYNVTIETEAPFIDGFVAIKSYVPQKIDDNSFRNLPATRYISLSQIEEITLTNDTLRDFGTYYIDPERAQKVKIER